MNTLLMIVLAMTVATPEVDQVLDVAPVWAGHPVGFCLLTYPPHQFVAFYDAERRMTVAQRNLDEESWAFTRLDETIAWDSHNYVTMVLDAKGFLHLSGNMHVKPLVYFRSERPFDATSLTRIPAMVGAEESHVTYPNFFKGPAGALYFKYRDGSSGSVNEIYNVYDVDAQSWKRLLDTPLVDGQGDRNAYFNGPLRGPDEQFHLCWIWRDTPDCATNHTISYARSADLVHWKRSDGKPYGLPITFATGEVVDPVPPGGGAINGNVRLGFDGDKRPIISYHKYDEQGFTQLYCARREDAGWRPVRVTDWQYRWEFSGGGSIPFEVRVSAVEVNADGNLVLAYTHPDNGSGRYVLDKNDLHVIEQLPRAEPAYPAELTRVESDFPEMQVKLESDSGTAGRPGIRYMLRWETLGPNRDKPRDPPLPPPNMLRLYRIRK